MNHLHQHIQTIVCAISTLRVPAMPGEYDLHSDVSAALTRAGIDHIHEYRLAPRCRIDFMVGRVGIEIKKGRPSPAALTKQLTRYLQSDELDAVIVLTQQAVSIPQTISGKPVHLITLNRLWGVALP